MRAFVKDYNFHFVSLRVFYRRYQQIIFVIKLIVLQMLFDSRHLEKYLQRKIRQFTSNVQVVDTITQALNSPETDRVISRRLAALYDQPEAYYLGVLGLSQEKVRPMIKPAVLSLCAETAPLVLDKVSDEGQHQVCHVTVNMENSQMCPLATEL